MENTLILHIPELERLAAAIDAQTAALTGHLAGSQIVVTAPLAPNTQLSPATPVSPAPIATTGTASTQPWGQPAQPAPSTQPMAAPAQNPQPNGTTPFAQQQPPAYHAATSSPAQPAASIAQPPAAPAAPAQAAPTAPTAPAVYTLEQLSLCGQALMDAGKNPGSVLQKYGLQALTMCPTELYPQIAAEFRSLGGAI